MSAPLRPRLPGERSFTVLLMVGSLFLLGHAYGISGFESITSAGTFPMLAALAMVVTAALSIAQAWTAEPEAAQAGESGFAQFVRRLSPQVLVVFTLAIALYMVALEPLGFLIASYVFLVLGMRILGSRRWALNLLVGAACLAAIYAVFQVAFSVVLPKGVILTALQEMLR